MLLPITLAVAGQMKLEISQFFIELSGTSSDYNGIFVNGTNDLNSGHVVEVIFCQNDIWRFKLDVTNEIVAVNGSANIEVLLHKGMHSPLRNTTPPTVFEHQRFADFITSSCSNGNCNVYLWNENTNISKNVSLDYSETRSYHKAVNATSVNVTFDEMEKSQSYRITVDIALGGNTLNRDFPPTGDPSLFIAALELGDQQQFRGFFDSNMNTNITMSFSCADIKYSASECSTQIKAMSRYLKENNDIPLSIKSERFISNIYTDYGTRTTKINFVSNIDDTVEKGQLDTNTIVMLVLLPTALVLVACMIIYCIFDYSKQSRRAKVVDCGWSDASATMHSLVAAARINASNKDHGFGLHKRDKGQEQEHKRKMALNDSMSTLYVSGGSPDYSGFVPSMQPSTLGGGRTLANKDLRVDAVLVGPPAAQQAPNYPQYPQGHTL